MSSSQRRKAREYAYKSDGWHDICVLAGVLDLSVPNRHRLFSELPEELRNLSLLWGTQDTVFRERAVAWLRQEAKCPTI